MAHVGEQANARARLLGLSRTMLTSRGPLAGLVLVVVVGLITLVPVLAIFYGSVKPDLGSEGGFTLESVREVYTSSEAWSSLVGTLLLAVTVGALSTVVGGVLAWLVARTDLPAKRTIELIVIAPLFTSPFVAAIAWFALAAPRSGLINILAGELLGRSVTLFNVASVPGIVWVLVLHYLPYSYLFIVAALRNMDPSLEEASHLNGYGTFATARRITIPLSLPSIASAFTFVVILTAGVFSVPAVLGVNLDFEPLPVLLYRAINEFISDFGKASAIGTMLFLVSVIFLFMYRRATRLERKFVTVSSRGTRPREVRLGHWQYYVVVPIFVIYGLVAVVLPNLAIVFMAFTPHVTRDLTKVHLGFDLIRELLGTAHVQSAITNTLIVVAVTVVACVLLGLVSAFVARYSGRVINRGLDYLNTLPIAVPGIVLASGLIWVYVRTPLYATLGILVVAYVTHYLPHAYRPIRNGTFQLDPALEEASFVNGAGRLRTGRKITAPLLSPAVLTAAMLVMIFTIREVNVAILLYAPDSRVLSVLTWDYISNGSLSEASVLGLLQTLMLVGALILARVVFRVRVSGSYV